MATYVPPKKNTAYITYVGLISQATPSILQANPTLAAGDVKVAIDDGAPANLTTLPVVDADFTKRVKVNLSAAEMNGDNISIIFSDAAGGEWCDLIINIQTTTSQIDDISAIPTANDVRDSILDDATRFSGANIDAAISSRSSHTAANVRDAILDDATRFSGANIDAAISSRSSHTAANVVTVMEADGGDLSSLMEALVNKRVWTETGGNLEMFNDAGVSQGNIAAQVTSDGTYTTAKRAFI